MLKGPTQAREVSQDAQGKRCGTRLTGRPATARETVGGPDRPSGLMIVVVLAFVGGLAALAALVPVGHGFAPKGGGWFIPAVVGGVFTLHPLLVAVPWAACFVSGLVDWRDPWRVEHLDLLALAGFFPVAMLLSDDAAQAGLWLAAACLCWLFSACSAWPLGSGGCRNCARRSAPGGWAWRSCYCCSSGSQASPAATSWTSGRRVRSAPGACCTGCTCTAPCPGRARAGCSCTARTPTARSPTTRTSRSRPSSRWRRPWSRRCCPRCASTR